MGNVFAVLILIILVFAATGVKEFGGNRFFRCRTTPEPVNGVWEIDDSIDRLCNAHGHGSYDCPSGTYCGTPYDYGLQPTHDEKYGSEFLSYGAASYENILRSFLISFQITTFDDWTKVMYRMADSDDAILSRIFFPCFVFIGAFLCLNLIVAVIVDTFQAHREELKKKDTDKRKAIEKGTDMATFGLYNAVKRRQYFFTHEQHKANDESAEKKPEDLNELEESPNMNKEESINKLINKPISNVITKSEGAEEEKVKVPQTGFRGLCDRVQENGIYKSLIIGLILFNLFILALNRKGISDKEVRVYNIFDIIIVVMFFLEMIIEFGALGFSVYMQTKYIDIIINVLGITELILTWSSQFDSKLNS
jgi:hypothetical protein